MGTRRPPRGTARLFPEEHGPRFDAGGLGPHQLERLLEDGDSADLRWLNAVVAEERIAAWVGERGGRQLSSRSRAFWSLLLGRAPGPSSPRARDLWPL